MYDEYKIVTKLKYDFSFSFFFFVFLPVMAEGVPAFVLVDPMVSKFNTVTEHSFVMWMVTSTSVYLKIS